MLACKTLKDPTASVSVRETAVNGLLSHLETISYVGLQFGGLVDRAGKLIVPGSSRDALADDAGLDE